MITVRIKGGLGNQLFQYAAAYALASRLQQEMSMDTTFYPKQTLRGFKLNQLHVDYGDVTDIDDPMIRILKNKYINKAMRKMNRRVLPCGRDSVFLLETRSDIVPEFFDLRKSYIYLDGYYQSEQYFQQHREELLKQFTPIYQPADAYKEVLKHITATNSVAIHVRRGDFISAQNDHNPNHYLLGESYYANALRYMDAQLDRPTYFWFSDDIEWVKKNFGERDNYCFVNLHTQNADIDEMMLMKHCNHIIAANSTFSWWAAWLNEHENALRVVPEKRYGNAHMIPESWIKVSVKA